MWIRIQSTCSIFLSTKHNKADVYGWLTVFFSLACQAQLRVNRPKLFYEMRHVNARHNKVVHAIYCNDIFPTLTERRTRATTVNMNISSRIPLIIFSFSFLNPRRCPRGGLLEANAWFNQIMLSFLVLRGLEHDVKLARMGKKIGCFRVAFPRVINFYKAASISLSLKNNKNLSISNSGRLPAVIIKVIAYFRVAREEAQ